MLRFIVRRLLVSIPLLLVASVLIFTVLHLTTDPAAGIRANPRATAADVQRYRHDLGLDRSGPAQYFAWLGNFVRGRWGTSLFTSIRVSTQIREALANSLFLGLTGFAIALLIGVSVGVIAAVRQYSVFDYLATSGAFVFLSVPVFWFALSVQLLFGLYMVRWLHLQEPIFFTAGLSRPGSVGFDLVDRLRHVATAGGLLAPLFGALADATSLRLTLTVLIGLPVLALLMSTTLRDPRAQEVPASTLSERTRQGAARAG